MKKRGVAVQEIESGLAAYRHERDVFLRLLRKRGSFTERDFDRWFRFREWHRKGRCRVRGIDGDSFMLGIGVNGGNLWAEMLDLLQWMVRLGEVRTSTRGGLVVYSAADNETPTASPSAPTTR